MRTLLAMVAIGCLALFGASCVEPTETPADSAAAVKTDDTAADETPTTTADESAETSDEPSAEERETPAPDEPAEPGADSPYKTMTERVSYCIGIDIGSNMKRQGVEVDPEILAKGLGDALFDRDIGPLVRAEDLAVPGGRALHPDDPVEKAHAVFAASKDDCIPVIERDVPHRLLGIVRRRDVLRMLVRRRGG